MTASDPVNEAVSRALAYGAGLVKSGQKVDFAPRNILPWAAREALAPVRELHKRCEGCTVERPHCDRCGPANGWPCDTSRLIYSEEEL